MCVCVCGHICIAESPQEGGWVGGGGCECVCECGEVTCFCARRVTSVVGSVRSKEKCDVLAGGGKM